MLTTVVECVLGKVFPPKLPKVAVADPTKAMYEEQGEIVAVREKPYRDAIHRHQQEQARLQWASLWQDHQA